MKMKCSYLEPAQANSFALYGTRVDGQPLMVQILIGEDRPLDFYQEKLGEMFARFEEELTKPAPPKPEPEPIDPSLEARFYDEIFRTAKAEGVEIQSYLASLKADGWEHMPGHARLSRKRATV